MADLQDVVSSIEDLTIEIRGFREDLANVMIQMNEHHLEFMLKVDQIADDMIHLG